MEIESNPLKDYIKDLLKQLQAYKTKEDRLREILKYEYSDAILGRFGRDLKYGLLQILNEGGKANRNIAKALDLLNVSSCNNDKLLENTMKKSSSDKWKISWYNKH